MFTYEDVRKSAEKVIREQGPDYVYKRVYDMCVYTHEDGSASCLVGRIADVLGVERPAWDDLDNERGITSVTMKHAFDEHAISVLEDMQDAQDSYKTWGTAYSEAFGREFPVAV